jgi:2-dehydropantoate 2-reductase
MFEDQLSSSDIRRSPFRIAIIGAGALGSLLAAKLAPLADVWLVTSWAEHAAAIRDQGLLLVDLDGTQRSVPVQVAVTVGDVPDPVPLALIAVKSHSTAVAAVKAQVLLAPDGLALTLQNGLGNFPAIAQAVGASRAAQGVTSMGATLLGPGGVRYAGAGPTYLAAQPETAGQIARAARLFMAAGFETRVTDNLESLVWGKLVVSAGINALTAILRVPNGVLVENPAARALMAAAATETAAVAAAQGIALPYPDPVARAEAVAQGTAQNRSSMLQDVLRGAPTEVDVINGAVARIGEQLGVAVPVNRMLLELVRALETTYGSGN